MSGVALIWAANVKGLKPAAKVVLIQLADFHNKETGRCDPSAKRLAYECEMDRATVFRHMKTLEERGLVTRHARGDGDGGRGSNHYELHIDLSLGPSSNLRVESQIATGVESQKGGGLSRNAATGVVANCDTNLLKEPGKNLTPIVPKGTDLFSAHEEAGSKDLSVDGIDKGFEEFWARIWPKHHRKVARSDCKKVYRAACVGAHPKADKVAPDVLNQCAEAYVRQESNNENCKYLKAPLAWLRQPGWEPFLEGVLANGVVIRAFEELKPIQIARLERGECPAGMQNPDGSPNAEGRHWLAYFGKWRAAE